MAAEDHHRSLPKVARPVTIRNVKNTCSFSFPLPPSPFPSTSFLFSRTPKTLQFLGKNAKIVMMMSVFNPHRGSYSLGRVLLRRYTLYACTCSDTYGKDSRRAARQHPALRSRWQVSTLRSRVCVVRRYLNWLALNHDLGYPHEERVARCAHRNRVHGGSRCS